jgi:uncharacterized protein (TIGR04222 family)
MIINPLSPHLRSLQRRPQAPHAESKFLAVEPTMNANDKRLLQKLEDFTIGKADVALNFTARLARENRWDQTFASRVIREYKRFVFLVIRAGHPVTPSEEVDQAWHQHLVYSVSYWKEMCGEILNQELHHFPTEGGLAQGGKFVHQYEETLRSYERLFDEKPPGDIWPAAEERFQSTASRWIDTRKYLLVPKPGFLRRKMVLPVISVFCLLAGTMMGTTACQGNGNVLDMEGGPFLSLYIGLLMAAGGCAASFILVCKRKDKAPVSSLEDPFEIACLGGGTGRIFSAALAGLLSKKLIRPGSNDRNLAAVERIGERSPDDLHGPEAVVYGSLEPGWPENTSKIRKSVMPALVGIQDKLVSDGLLMSKTQATRMALLSAIPFLLLGILGVLKILTGLDRGQPVGFLVILFVVSIGMVWGLFKIIPRRTRSGENVWKELQQELPKLRHRIWTAKQADLDSEQGSCPNSTAIQLAALSPLAIAIVGPEAFSLLGEDYVQICSATPEESGGFFARRGGDGGDGDGGDGDGGDGDGGSCGGGCGGCGGGD